LFFIWTSVVEVSKTQAQVASVSLSIPSSLAAGQKARAIATPKTPTARPSRTPYNLVYVECVDRERHRFRRNFGDGARTAVVSAVSEGISVRPRWP